MALKKQYQTFINEIIKHGDQIRAYKAAYPKATKETCRVQSYRLIQNSTISKAIKDNAEKITAIATGKAIEELKNEIKVNVLTAMKKREILTKIILGELETEKIIPTNTGFKKVKYLPDFADRMKAIDIDNKMAGDYAPDKLEHSGSVLPFSDAQVDKILNELRANR